MFALLIYKIHRLYKEIASLSHAWCPTDHWLYTIK